MADTSGGPESRPVVRREVRKRPKLLKRLNLVPHAFLMALSPRFRAISRQPVFIVGCGHSGTTLLLRILAAHPNLHAVMEESNTFIKARYENLRTYDLLTFFRGRGRWVEKTPNHVYYLAEIFAARPMAKVILVLRDGRDVAVSLRKRTGSFRDGVLRWLDDNAAGAAHAGDPRVLLVRYEDLVADLPATAARILDFLGEAPAEAVLSFQGGSPRPDAAPAGAPPVSQAGNRAHFEYRMWQVAQPLFNGSRKWAAEMSAEEKALFKEMAGEMLIRYGYEQDMNW